MLRHRLWIDQQPFAASVCATLFILITIASPAFGQAQRLPQFEVSSVKIGQYTRGDTYVHNSPGRTENHNVVLRSLILRAFGIAADEVVWPEWVNSDTTHYDVTATFPVDTSAEQLQLMWQDLLVTRFGFRARRELRSIAVYAITTSPNGLLIKKANTPADPSALTMLEMRPTYLSLKGDYPINRIVTTFRSYLDRPLVDLTGLEGVYSINISVPRNSVAPDATIPTAQYTSDMVQAMNGMDIGVFISAMEKQLGLHVAKQAVLTNMLIIDNINKTPSLN